MMFPLDPRAPRKATPMTQDAQGTETIRLQYFVCIAGDGGPTMYLLPDAAGVRRVLADEFFGPGGPLTPDHRDEEAARWADFCDVEHWSECHGTPYEWSEQGEDYAITIYKLLGEAALVAPQAPAPAADGVSLIAAERQRQIEREGWTSAHDDTHTRGEMVVSAVRYAVEDASVFDSDLRARLSWAWPWQSCDWKPKDAIRNLVRAGALIAAEIDRLQRQGREAAGALRAAVPPLDVEAMRANLHATFNGGHEDEPARRAFHHGMDTVCNVLAAQVKGEPTNGILPAAPPCSPGALDQEINHAEPSRAIMSTTVPEVREVLRSDHVAWPAVQTQSEGRGESAESVQGLTNSPGALETIASLRELYTILLNGMTADYDDMTAALGRARKCLEATLRPGASPSEEKP